MCDSNPEVVCLKPHHRPVVVEVWSNTITGDFTSDLVTATRTDLDTAVSMAAKVYDKTVFVRDWFTGETWYLPVPKKRRQVVS